MTPEDRHYMVDVDDENLLDFLAWHRTAWHDGKFRGMTIYSMLKMAWMAAKNGPPVPEAPVPTALEPLPPAPRMPWSHQQPGGGLSTATLEHVKANATPPPEPDPDPFASVRLSGPQQAAMDSLYPLLATPKVWTGDPVRIEAPETRPMRVIPDGFELVDSFDPANMVVGGPTETWPRAEDG
jgi:hypothetical protein